MTEQYLNVPKGTAKETDPYWFRKNSTATMGATACNSNPVLGIEDITINDASDAQRKYNIISSGFLKSAIGSIAFHIRLSKKGHPFVQTISTESGVKEDGSTRYFEHIILKPQVKAQIMRFYEALQTGTVVPAMPVGYAPYPPAPYGQMPYPQQPYGQMPYQQPAPVAPVTVDYSQFKSPTVEENGADIQEDELPY